MNYADTNIEGPSQHYPHALEALYTSPDPADIARFYDWFQSPQQLVDWMRSRPRGRGEIHEWGGDSEVTVVIPTADVNSEYSRNSRRTFEGLTIVFVDSGRRDPYFNYATNSNRGILHALRQHSPKWIVLSNDDMVKVDPPSVLVDGLSTLDHRKTVLVHTDPPTGYHSYEICIVKPKRIRNTLYRLVEPFSLRLRLYRRLQVEYDVGPLQGIFSTLYTKVKRFRLTGSLTILSAHYAAKVGAKVFDETYINSVEDVDLCYRLSGHPESIASVKYRIGDIVGGTIGGFSKTRSLREIANWAYFNHKIRRKELGT